MDVPRKTWHGPSQACDEPFHARNEAVKHELGPLHHEMGHFSPGTAFPSPPKYLL